MSEVYPNLTVTFLIEYGGRFLLVERSPAEANFPALWAFPGGKCELHETIVQTIRREVTEETGLELTDQAVFLDSYYFKNSVGIAFLVRAVNDRVLLSSENRNYRWVYAIDEMAELSCIPGIYNHLIRAQDRLKDGIFDSLESMNLEPSKYLNS
jgi:8-oxo-dGTP pyrophosphatase MutT (NUDIX family)